MSERVRKGEEPKKRELRERGRLIDESEEEALEKE